MQHLSFVAVFHAQTHTHAARASQFPWRRNITTMQHVVVVFLSTIAAELAVSLFSQLWAPWTTASDNEYER